MSKLIEAKQLLIERGITRSGYLEDSNGCLCAIGALNMAYTGRSGQYFDGSPEAAINMIYTPLDPNHQADIAALAEVVVRRVSWYHPGGELSSYKVWNYNDDKAHTDEDILSLFDEAANL